MNRVLIMRGMPGSGKTTEAQRWAELVPGARILSADDYMFAGGQAFDYTRLERCHEQCKIDFTEALKERAPLVILDNTNTKFADLVPYIELIEEYRYSFTVLQLHVTPKFAFEHNKHGVPLETLQHLGRRIWSERLPASWDVWNKGKPWKPHDEKTERAQPQFRHSWSVPHPMGDQCAKCLVIRVPSSRQRKPRAGAKVVHEKTSYSYYAASGGVVGEGLRQQPECTK